MFENFFKYKLYEKLVLLTYLGSITYWIIFIDNRAVLSLLIFAFACLYQVKKEKTNHVENQ